MKEKVRELKGLELNSIKLPVLSEWTCYMFGGSPSNPSFAWTPEKGDEPCWFWRKMQYIIFGNRWVKK